jgi:hypothetical protein
MTVVKKNFVVSFGIRGFYAQYQPNFEWNFTQDISKAKLYKSIKGASLKAQQGTDLRNKAFSQKVLGNNFYSQWGYDTLPEPEIFEVDSKGLHNMIPVPKADIRSKLIKKVEQDALSPEFLKSLFP